MKLESLAIKVSFVSEFYLVYFSWIQNIGKNIF